MQLAAFINTNFTSTGDLAVVDDLLRNLDHPEGLNGENNAISIDDSTQSVYNHLKTIALAKESISLKEMDILIAKNGSSPLISFTREIVVQKLQLQREKTQIQTFLSISNNINTLKEWKYEQGATKDEKNDLLLQLSNLKNEISNFNETFQLNNSLIDEFQSLIKRNILQSFQYDLTSSSKEWDSDKPLENSISTSLLEFEQLLKLQLISTWDSLEPGKDTTLWAIDCLISSFKTKFIYHFEGTGETNRIDKPEFALSYTQTYIHKYLPICKSIWNNSFNKSIKNNSLITPSFSSWFITSLLAILRNKFNLQMNTCKSNGKLLSHLVNELKKFDIELTNEFNFVPSQNEEWKGLTYDLILSDESVWETWLSNEKEFVNKRFQEIIDSPQAFNIEHDVIEDGKTKPSKSSVNLKNLLESITDSYSNLPIAFQMKFLSEVQLKLLNFYFTTLKNGLSALSFIKSTSVDGVSTLERICRIFCASDFLVEMMNKWDNSIVFIQLWQSINGDKLDTTFFGSVIKGYKNDILAKIPKLLIKYFDMQLNRTMKEYFSHNRDWSLKSYDNDMPSVELDQVISSFESDFQYLSITISKRALIKWKGILSKNVAQYLENNMLLSYKFSSAGATKFQKDVEYLFQKLDLIREKATYGRVVQILQFYIDGSKGELISGNELTFLNNNSV